MSGPGLFDNLEPPPLELRQERIDRPQRGELLLFLVLEPNPDAGRRGAPAWRQVSELLARNLTDAAGVELEARGWRDAFWRHPRRGAIIGARGRQKFAVIDPRELKAVELA